MRNRSILIAALIFCSSQAHAQSQIFGDFGVPAWSRMHKFFETRFGQVAKDEQVLVLPVATNAAWDSPIKTLRLTEMYKWGDWMPSQAWQYAPNSGKRVSEGYQFFLNHAWIAAVEANGTISNDVKTALKRANEELQFTRAEYAGVMDDAEKAYEIHVRNTPRPERLSKAAFFKKFAWDADIAAKQMRQTMASKKISEITKQLVDPDIEMLSRAQLRFDNPNQKIMLPATLEVLNDKDRWQSYYISLIDKDIFDFLGERNLESQSIDESKSKSEIFEQRWSASVSVSFLGLFRAGGASAEQTRREKHIRTNTTKIDISFENVDTFNIVRGEWFDENVIARFAPKLKSEAWNAVLGKNGQLELIPKSVLVGRGMSFAIYADSQSLDYIYEHFHASADAGFYIGWWRVGGGGDYSSTKEQTEIYKYTDRIVFRDLSGRGKVLGLLAKNYGASTPKPAFVNAILASQPAALMDKRKIDQDWPKSDILSKARLDAATMQDVQVDVFSMPGGLQ